MHVSNTNLLLSHERTQRPIRLCGKEAAQGEGEDIHPGGGVEMSFTDRAPSPRRIKCSLGLTATVFFLGLAKRACVYMFELYRMDTEALLHIGRRNRL